MIGDLGWQELLIILLIVIVIFGAGKLPEIGSGLGKGIKEFKKETGVGDKDEKDRKKIEEGTSEPASALTHTAVHTHEKVEAGVNGTDRHEVRADDI